MPTKFQCNYCLHAMAMPDKFVGRKILCPMCSEPIVIPKADSKRLFKKQNLAEAIEKFKLTDWDRVFAKTVYEEKILNDKELLHAIAGTIKVCKKGPEISLGEYLHKEKLLTSEKCQEIREQQRGKIGKEKDTLIECPNCFANVSSSLRACKFCGQKLGEAATVELCPSCKNEQPRGLSRCRRCTADMKTGLRPTSQRCPKCSELIIGSAKECPKCKTSIGKPGKSRAAKPISKGKIAVLAIAALVLIAFLPGLLHPLFVGSEQAALEEKVEILREALVDNSLDQIERCLDPDKNIKITGDSRNYIIGGLDFDKSIKKIKDIETLELTVSKDKKTAEVRMKIKAVVTDKRKKGEDIIRRIFQGKTKELTPTWKWRMLRKRWVLTSPLK